MTKSEQREELFKLLFRAEFNDSEEMKTQKELFIDERMNKPEEILLDDDDEVIHYMNEKEANEVLAKAEDILEKLPQIDNMLNEKVTGWDISRIGKTEITILRLAVYEISMDESIPLKVAINEAVELAKKFGQDSSAGFVNGVLAKFTK